MHVECSACGARYTIADEKIPVQGARVRCRKCHAVFPVGRAAQPPVPVELPLIPPSPQSRRPAPPSRAAVSEFTRGFEHVPGFAAPAPVAHVGPASPLQAVPVSPSQAVPASSSPAAPASSAPPASSSSLLAPPASGPRAPIAPSPSPVEQSYTSAGIPPGLPEAERVKHERARRLARVLASDIAVYNKEKRERGIQEGNLVAILGYEIKKSWEVYKERVTPQMANSTPYFRDALNEMLAEGKKIF